ncbi:MAG: hypothetical protein ACYTEP_00910 [Planctomycetota bacterium]|jgi:hypothetical protein
MSGVKPSGGPPSFFEERRPSSLLVQRSRLGSGALLLLVVGAVLLGWTPWWSALWMAGFALVFQWWMFVTRFTVRLEDQVLALRLAPFPTKRIPVEQITGAATHMSYPWGIGKRGWSIQRSPGVTVFFTDPGAGLVLELENGQAVWFNARRPEELAALLRPGRKKRRGSQA